MPIIDNRGNLLYLVTRTDIEKNEEHPFATKDEHKRLRVFIAVETNPEKYKKKESTVPMYHAILYLSSALEVLLIM